MTKHCDIEHLQNIVIWGGKQSLKNKVRYKGKGIFWFQWLQFFSIFVHIQDLKILLDEYYYYEVKLNERNVSHVKFKSSLCSDNLLENLTNHSHLSRQQHVIDIIDTDDNNNLRDLSSSSLMIELFGLSRDRIL